MFVKMKIFFMLLRKFLFTLILEKAGTNLCGLTMKPFIKYPDLALWMHRSTMTGSVFRAFEKISEWSAYLQELGIGSIILNPPLNRIITDMILEIFDQSTAASAINDDFALFCKDLHAHQINIILDGVFNHVGRGFWAFQDV